MAPEAFFAFREAGVKLDVTYSVGPDVHASNLIFHTVN